MTVRAQPGSRDRAVCHGHLNHTPTVLTGLWESVNTVPEPASRRTPVTTRPTCSLVSETKRAELAGLCRERTRAEDRPGVLEGTFLLLRPGGFGYGREAFVLTHAGNSNYTVTRMARLPKVFHTDRGTQYDSEQITTYTNENGITRLVGHTGICCDNPMAESFLSTLRNEFYYGRVWPTKAQAKRDVGARIGAATTVAAGTSQSARSAPPRSRCGTRTTPRQHVKALDPVFTVGFRANAADSSEQFGGTGGHAPGRV